jgi:hypothetical protein
MIQPSELRVGNFLYIVPYYEVVTVTNVTSDWLGVFANGTHLERVSFDLVDPIKLTYQWLKDLRFTGRTDFMYKGIVGVQIRDGKFYLALKDLSNVIFHSVVEVKYVHHLQNLYLDLTGEVLNLK